MSIPGLHTILLTTFCEKHCRVHALSTCILLFFLLFLLSCTAGNNNIQQPGSGQLLAENSMMKKRLPLIERESDVLKKENQQQRMKIQDLELQNKQLGTELAVLREKYESDMAVGNQQISSLEETLQEKEQESRISIDRLMADHQALKEKMDRDLRALKDQIVMQKAAFNQQRDQLVQENSKRELSLTNKLGAAEKKLAVKESEILSLQSSSAEISGKLVKANAISAELASARTATVAELESLKAAGIKAQKKYQAQLESIRAANADLTKKIAVLSNDLSRQKHTDPTPIKQP